MSETVFFVEKTDDDKLRVQFVGKRRDLVKMLSTVFIANREIMDVVADATMVTIKFLASVDFDLDKAEKMVETRNVTHKEFYED